MCVCVCVCVCVYIQNFKFEINKYETLIQFFTC